MADIRRFAASRTDTLSLAVPERAVAVCVVGHPSSGAAPDTYEVSCAELQIFVR
jgi:hypothetical protein